MQRAQIFKILFGNSAVASYAATAIIGFLTWLLLTVRQNEELKAENKYRYVNDSLRISVMELHLYCPGRQ